MSSEFLASGENVLDSNLGGAWDITNGYAGRKQDLGIARRFGGSAAAYSLRDIGAMNGRVVKVRRDVDGQGTDPEEDFSANQVASGALEDWVNGKLENTLPADVATAAAAYSLRKVKASYSGPVIGVRRADGAEGDVYFDSDDKLSINSIVRFSSTESTGSFSVTGNGVQYNKTYTYNTSNGRWEAQGIESSQYYFLDSGTWTLVYGGSNTLASLVSGQYPWVSTWGSFVSGSVFDISNVVFGLNDMTMGEFISGTDVFVHTWYDQAGSNDATQTTSANQPVIAESGTLLTNSMGTPTLKFVGGGLSGSSYTSGDNLDANGLASSFTGEDKAISSFAVTSAFANNKNGVIYGFGDSSDDSAKVTSLFHSGGGMGIQLRDDADNAITDQTNVSYSSNEDLLFSFTRPNTTYDLNKNSVNLRNDIASDLGTTTLDRFSIGTLTRTSQALFLDGDITELIIYASDQVDNRFKIESNINNYYGLYNDANDTSDTEWQFHNTETGTSANGTDGYVFKNSDADVGVATLELKQGVVSGDKIYYSFFYDRTSGSPTVRLASDKTDSASGVSNDNGVGTNSGFISGTLTATGTGSFFMIADNDNPSDFTISNFKMSRIERNGFVETWYDQSGNGNNATQGTAGNQPKIVSSGSIVTESQGKPAIDMINGTVTKFAMGSEVSMQSMFAVCSVVNVGGTAQCLLNKGGTNNKYFRFKGSSASFAPEAKFTSLTAAGTAISSDVGNLVEYNRDDSNDNTIFINGTQQTLTSNTINVDIPTDVIGTRVSANDPYAGKIQEIILFEVDKSGDREDLRNDMANFYNITLS